MAISPFGLGSTLGFFHDLETDEYVVINPHTKQSTRVPAERFYDMSNKHTAFEQSLRMQQAASHAAGMIATSALYNMYGGTRKEESVKDKLVRTRFTRWRSRMLRIREKLWEKRLGKLANLGWYVACVWGAIIATMLSIKLLKWLTAMILG